MFFVESCKNKEEEEEEKETFFFLLLLFLLCFAFFSSFFFSFFLQFLLNCLEKMNEKLSIVFFASLCSCKNFCFVVFSGNFIRFFFLLHFKFDSLNLLLALYENKRVGYRSRGGWKVCVTEWKLIDVYQVFCICNWRVVWSIKWFPIILPSGGNSLLNA